MHFDREIEERRIRARKHTHKEGRTKKKRNNAHGKLQNEK